MDTLQQVADNLRRPGGRIPEPAVGGWSDSGSDDPNSIFRVWSKVPETTSGGL